MGKNKIKTNDSTFTSKIGFVLAAAGSAVGLGNIWRFPYLAAKYGGGVFLLVYIILAVSFGFALMITEIAIGRRTQSSVLTAYGKANKGFSFLGIIAALVPIIILPYYCVIGGWVIKYFGQFVAGLSDAAAEDGFFTNFISGVSDPTIFFLIFVALTSIVVILGVQKGIELVSKILMPVLLVLIVGIAIFVMTLDGAWDGIKYYLLPNFSTFVTDTGAFDIGQLLKTVIAAMGQLFYSMSLAMGIMITYGSYMRKSDPLEKSVRQIEIFDTAVALLAGLIIVPAAFIFFKGDASQLNAGPSLLFITMPKVFQSMNVGGISTGAIVGTIFFILVILAALTSSISLMETIVAVVIEKLKVKRIWACLITIALTVGLGMLSILGYSIWSDFSVPIVGGLQILDFFDFISNNIMMPIVALLTCILIGYVVKTKFVTEEVLASQKSFKAQGFYKAMVLVVCPIFMLVILISPFFISL